jgi:hypothetical protein
MLFWSLSRGEIIIKVFGQVSGYPAHKFFGTGHPKGHRVETISNLEYIKKELLVNLN